MAAVVWQWDVPPAAYREQLLELAHAAGLALPATTLALEAALHAASDPRFLHGGARVHKLRGGGMFMGRGNDEDEDEDDDEDEGDDDDGSVASAEMEHAPLDPEALGTAHLVPRLGGAPVDTALLYKGAPQCQALCTRTQFTDLGTCWVDGAQCDTPASVRATPDTDAERAALRAYLVDGARPDAATGAYFLCKAHHTYMWTMSVARAALKGIAVASLAAASVAVLGPLAAAVAGFAAAAAAPLVSRDAWHALRSYLRRSDTSKHAALVAAAANPEGGQALVMQDEAARVLGPSEKATRRLMAAYGGSTDTRARNDLVLLHALTPAFALPPEFPSEEAWVDFSNTDKDGAGLVDVVARAGGMSDAVAALRTMLPALETAPRPLIAACVNLGVNSANWWRVGARVLARQQHILEAAARGEVPRALVAAARDTELLTIATLSPVEKTAAAALIRAWVGPAMRRVYFTPASLTAARIAGQRQRNVEAIIDAASAAYTDAVLRLQIAPAADALDREHGVDWLLQALEGRNDAIPAFVRTNAVAAARDVAHTAAKTVAAYLGMSVNEVSSVVTPLSLTLGPSMRTLVGAVSAFTTAALPAHMARDVDAAKTYVTSTVRALARALDVTDQDVSALPAAEILARAGGNAPAVQPLVAERDAATKAYAAERARYVAGRVAARGRILDAAADALDARLVPRLPTETPLASLLRLNVPRRLTQSDAEASVAQHAVAAAAAQFIRDASAAGLMTPRDVADAALDPTAEETAESDETNPTYAAALALAQVALARVEDASFVMALAGKRREATAAAPVATVRADKVAGLDVSVPLLAHGSPERARQLTLLLNSARDFTSLLQWVALLDADADAYKAGLPLLLMQASAAFADNHAAGVMDLRKTAAFLGLTADDMVSVRRLAARLIPLLTLLNPDVTPHRGVIELLRYNVLMLLRDGELRAAIEAAAGPRRGDVAHALAPLEAEFDAD